MSRTPKGRSEAEKQLDEDVRNAQALGMSYGKYKALCISKGIAPCAPPKQATPKRRKRRAELRKFEDCQALGLWQSGLSDARIGELLGVRRQTISAWRRKNGLPTQMQVKTGGLKHSDYILTVDASGEMTIARRRQGAD